MAEWRWGGLRKWVKMQLWVTAPEPRHQHGHTLEQWGLQSPPGCTFPGRACGAPAWLYLHRGQAGDRLGHPTASPAHPAFFPQSLAPTSQV